MYPIDDRSNSQMPLAHLHASFLNSNRDPSKQRAFTIKDTLLFDQREDEGSIDDLLLQADW